MTPHTTRLDAERAVLHLDELYRYATALTGDRGEAEDLVHDVIEGLLRRPRFLRARDNVRAYLFSMLRHRQIDAFRRRCRRPQVELEQAEWQPARVGAGPAEHAEQREVLAAIARLPLHHREVVVAVDVAGLSYGEAAEALGVPVGTVMSRLHRARSRVVAALEAPEPRFVAETVVAAVA